MRGLVLLLVAPLALACGGAPPRGPTVVLVEDASDEARPTLQAAVRAAEAHLPVVLEHRDLPAPAAREPAAEHDFAETRTAYDDGDLERCLASLPDAATITVALERGDRTLASRSLYWRMACLRALGQTDEALALAHDHAVRGLPLPPDVGAANVTAETMLRDAHRLVSALPRARVHVTSEPVGAQIAVDGAPTEQVTPTDLDLAPGAHLVTLAMPTYALHSVEIVASEATVPLEVALTPLEPEAAALALHASVDSGASLDADLSLALLVTALRARSLVLVSRDADRVRAALIGTGDSEGHRTVVRAERVGEHTDDLEGLLRDVLVRGRLVAPPPPFYELPEVWVAALAAVAIGVGVTLALTLQPEVHTTVTLP